MNTTIYGIKNCDTMIKRPVLDVGGRLVVGFKSEIYERAVRASR